MSSVFFGSNSAQQTNNETLTMQLKCFDSLLMTFRVGSKRFPAFCACTLSIGTVPAALFALLFFAFPRCQTLLTLSFVITPLMQSSSWPSSPSQLVSYPLFKTQRYYVSLPSKSIFPLLHLHLIQDVLKTLSKVTISHLLTLLHPQTFWQL